MILKNLHLTNFRNFSKLDLDFSKATLLVGNNAQGKSNLLESIYFLATGKSLRADKDIQLIKEGEEFVRVEGEVDQTKLEVVMQKRQEDECFGLEKRVKVNGIPKRVIDYIGNLVVVHFCPEDINLVTGPPSLRRYHLDLTLAQIDKQYKKALATYSESLVSRNRLLKNIREGLSKPDELGFWTEQLIGAGDVISEKRRQFFQSLNEQVSYLSMPEGALGEFKFVYQENVLSLERLKQYADREIAAATTLIGPHRDDFLFEIKGKNLSFFGSRGEQRTGVLELKLAELKFIHNTKGIIPVLLLDDVFSELDFKHRDYVMHIIGGQQTVLSAVETSQVPEEFLKSMKIVKIEKGRVCS